MSILGLSDVSAQHTYSFLDAQDRGAVASTCHQMNRSERLMLDYRDKIQALMVNPHISLATLRRSITFPVQSYSPSMREFTTRYNPHLFPPRFNLETTMRKTDPKTIFIKALSDRDIHPISDYALAVQETSRFIIVPVALFSVASPLDLNPVNALFNAINLRIFYGCNAETLNRRAMMQASQDYGHYCSITADNNTPKFIRPLLLTKPTLRRTKNVRSFMHLAYFTFQAASSVFFKSASSTVLKGVCGIAENTLSFSIPPRLIVGFSTLFVVCPLANYGLYKANKRISYLVEHRNVPDRTLSRTDRAITCLFRVAFRMSDQVVSAAENLFTDLFIPNSSIG